MTPNFPKRVDRKAVYESDWVCLYADKVAMPDEVETLVGHVVGGVCPFAVNAGVEI